MKIPEIIQKFNSNKKLLYIAATILLFLIYKIYVWANTESTDNAYVDSNISTVSAEISGTLLEVLCVDNQAVKAGDVLAKIEAISYAASADAAHAKVKSGEYQLTSIEQKIELESHNLKKAQALIDYSKTTLELSTTDYKRNLALHQDKYSSQKVLDESKSALEKAKFDFSQANIAFEISQKNIEILNIQKLITQEDLEVLKQAQITAEDALKNTIIVSPIDGIIASSGLRKGNFVRPGTPLISVVPQNSFIKANFKETQVLHLSPGQDVEFTIDAIKSYKFYGKIRSIYPATGSKFSLIPSDNATGNFTKIVQRIPVIIDFDHSQKAVEMIRTGMSVTVHARF